MYQEKKIPECDDQKMMWNRGSGWAMNWAFSIQEYRRIALYVKAWGTEVAIKWDYIRWYMPKIF